MARLLLLCLVLLPACGRPDTFEVQGTVVGFGDDPRLVIIAHDEVPGFMPAMTMPFRVAQAEALQGIHHGDVVAFTLHVEDERTWIDRLAVTGRAPSATAAPAASHAAGTRSSAVLAVGDPVPDVPLVDHTGRRFHITDYREQYLLLTFIYTRCPLPDYCPRLSANYAALQSVLPDRYGDRVRLLSVSFDTAYDTPDVLAAYGRRHGADPDVWTLATGTAEDVSQLTGAFGVATFSSGQVIDHNLATALVGPDGRVLDVWRGTEWSAEAVLTRLERLIPPTGDSVAE